jgi:hypothetical protein
MNKRTGMTIGGTRYFMVFPLLENRIGGSSLYHVFQTLPDALGGEPERNVVGAPHYNMPESIAAARQGRRAAL